MDIRSFQTAAATMCQDLADPDRVRVYISSDSRNPLAAGIAEKFRSEIESNGLKAVVNATGSMGYNGLEPIAVIEKPGQFRAIFNNLTPDKVIQISRKYLQKVNPEQEDARGYTGDTALKDNVDISTQALFKLQNRISLRNCGLIDPEDIHHYILHAGGYTGFVRLLDLSPRDIIQGLGISGLRDRGWDSEVTSEKWRTVLEAKEPEKYIACIAFDIDQNACAARLLLESDPHSVLEGLLIGAMAVRAKKGIICIDSRNHTANQRLEIAIEQMRSTGLLGANILDSDFNFEIEVVETPIYLVSGEETALLSFLEGKPALPYWRPSYFFNKGINNKPTLVSDAETLANVSAIFQKSPDWFATTGTEKSKGSRIITLCGDVNNSYTIEVPFGISIHSLVMDIGGGVCAGRKLKAVQIGGATGVFYNSNSLDIPLSIEGMQEYGYSFNNGVIEVFDDNKDLIEIVRKTLSYLHSQSCGQCVFCREGTYQMEDILYEILGNRGKQVSLEQLEELGKEMQNGCICQVGRLAANPVLSSLKEFKEDFKYHISEHR
jgi:NADH-quinone oxidoreductase subunit F